VVGRDEACADDSALLNYIHHFVQLSLLIRASSLDTLSRQAASHLFRYRSFTKPVLDQRDALQLLVTERRSALPFLERDDVPRGD